ncbi:Non-histone chromosomal protein 6 [Rhizophlyctis rosea]|uniref:Non-histone chromosomal protein 6 n=1 Tax=Rhizophlyctis rosea TaxID=64517 RepID=A0AAD5S2P9_9FUNG|nr:Non-histone chromosomal protein 6 [Rhizophlyctis rosea]
MAKDKKERTVTTTRKAAAPDAGKRKKKAKKDPNAPKKPLSAFIIFSNENRARIKEENPAAEFKDIGKLLGTAWRGMGESEKQKYQKKADQDKERYAREEKAYKPGAANDDDEDEEEEDDE